MLVVWASDKGRRNEEDSQCAQWLQLSISRQFLSRMRDHHSTFYLSKQARKWNLNRVQVTGTKIILPYHIPRWQAECRFWFKNSKYRTKLVSKSRVPEVVLRALLTLSVMNLVSMQNFNEFDRGVRTGGLSSSGHKTQPNSDKQQMCSINISATTVKWICPWTYTWGPCHIAPCAPAASPPAGDAAG